jgi:DNA primase catalytic subunit
MIREKPTKHQVKSYYEEYFNPLELGRIINIQRRDFERREFAWMPFPDEGIPFRRNARFNTIEKFLESIISTVPYKLYHGAVYTKKWSKSVKYTPWLRNELHFDIDINDFELARKNACSCGSGETKEDRKKVCNDCFELVKEAGIFLIETLHDDFGYDKKHALTYFSGTRGIHVHYPRIDRVINGKLFTETMEREARKNLISYITIVNEIEVPDKDGNIELVADISKQGGARGLESRIDSLVYKWFLLKSSEINRSLCPASSINAFKIGIEKGSTVSKIIKEHILRTGMMMITPAQLKRLHETVMECRYPRYDGTPTHDIKKVIKVPRSVDSSTGCIVTRIDNLEGFKLDDVDHVLNHVR